MVKSSTSKLFITALASFAMVLPLAGCSKDSGNGSGQEKTPEYIYESTFNDLGNAETDYVGQAFIKDGSIYMTGFHYEESKKGSGKTTHYLITGSSGSNKLDTTKIKGLKKNEGSDKLFIDEDGNIHILSYIYDYNEKTNTSNTKYYMSILDKKGQLSGRTELKPGLKKNEEFYISSNSVAYVNEKLIIASERKIYIFNKDGSIDKTCETDTYIDSIFTTNDGKIYIMGSMDKIDGTGFCELDAKTGKLGDPASFSNYSIYNIKGIKHGKDSIVYLGNDDGIYKCDLDKKQTELLFNWINVDVNSDDISDFQITEDENLTVLCTSYNYDSSGNDSSSSSVEIANINKKKYSEVKQKKMITLAANYISQELKDAILKYNKSNNDYHIEFKSYNAYDDPQKQMNLDIISGDVPDIIEMSGLSKSMYIKKGLLTDLNPLIEKDGELKKEDLVDSVINTIEHDGKLYYMPTSYSIIALAGSKKIFNGMEGWTYGEMEEKYKSLPEGGVFMQGMTSDWFIQNMLSSQIKDFINFETGEVNIDSEEFIHMLEFSKNFQTNDEYMKEMEENNWKQESIHELVKSGRLLLNNMYLYDFSDIQVNEKLYKSQGGYDIISQPSKDKNNKLSMGSADACLAVSEKCSDKEGAWKFLRRLYLPEYQKSVSRYNGFPIRKDALEKKIEYAMATKAYTDDDGTKVTPIEGDTYSMDDFTVELKPYTKAHMDLFRSMVNRIGKEDSYDTAFYDISEMIEEETKAFFAGDKTAKETAEILQSKVKIYVSENS